MYETDAFLSLLISDTKASVIQWSIVGSWGDGPCSLDFRETNPVLNEITSCNAFAFDHWSNMLIANVMSGFVYLSKQPGVPPRYSIYIQTDCHSKITEINLASTNIQKLYEAAANQLMIDTCEILDFIDSYINSHSVEMD